MKRRPPRSIRTDTLCPYTTLVRSLLSLAGQQAIAEGFWLRAERQSGGRGRLARRWESPAGNLYCSTLVQLRPHDPPPGTLALVTAVAEIGRAHVCTPVTNAPIVCSMLHAKK